MALDPRTHELADKILEYSLSITPHDTLLVYAEEDFADVGYAVGANAALRGADVRYQFIDLEKTVALIDRADEGELAQEAQQWIDLITPSTARINIYASERPDRLSGLDPQKVKRYKKVVCEPYMERVTGNGKEFPGIKWNVCGYPSRAQARITGMPFEKYATFVFDSILKPDWLAMAKQMERAKEAMDGAREVRILVPGDTDLRLSLEGRGSEICAGKYNMPDGEFFYGPVEGSARGHIRFPYETRYDSTPVEDVRIVFGENGRAIVERCTAKTGEAFLRRTISQSGADMPGELGIGCNYGITRSIANILFDEKIGGTIHLAMGDSYKVPLSAGGGLNESSEHWDLIAELRPVNGHPGGEIYVDGQLIQKNGHWRL